MENRFVPRKVVMQRGSVFGFLFLLLIFLLIILIMSQGYIRLSKSCVGEDFFSCALDEMFSDKPEPAAEEGSVTANGSLSGEFKGKTGSVTVSLTFPLTGGAVTGSFSGDCDGSIKGTYVADTGAISGSGSGSCAFVFPASGTFSGTVNKSSKTVSVTGEGSAMGFSKTGSLTLTY